MDFANYWFSSSSGGGGGYQIDNSLRFRGAQYLSRTPATNSTTRTKHTISVWTKKAPAIAVSPNNTGLLFLGANSGVVSNSFNVGMSASTEAIQYYQYNSGYNGSHYGVSRLRDPSAWYHFVFIWDSTLATAADRIQVWINGVRDGQDTNAGPAPTTPPSLNQEPALFTTVPHTISKSSIAVSCYMAELHAVDGTALAPTEFGEFNADGVWVPIDVTGLTYGTNGFYLDFSDPADIGADRSGNGNNFTPTGFELTNTSSTNYDWVTDSPTDNYSTLNPLDRGSTNLVPTKANLGISYATKWDVGIKATQGVSSGKWYWEYHVPSPFPNSPPDTGFTKFKGQITAYTAGQGGYNDPNTYFYRGGTGAKVNGNYTGTAYGTALQAGDVLQCALDLDNGKAWWGRNNTWQASGNPAAGTNEAFSGLTGEFWPMFYWGSSPGTTGGTGDYNFGNRPFAHTPPAGFEPLSAAEMPDVGITNPSDHFQTILASGSAITYWGKPSVTTGATSTSDGLSNSQIIWALNGDYPPFNYVKSLNDGNYQGYNDWFVPSIYELEIAYYNLKPTTQNNTVVSGGDNPNAVPARTGRYSGQTPSQTSVTAFQSGGAQAFDAGRYTFSTEFNATVVGNQDFADGYRYQNVQKYTVSGRTRAVRREPWTGSEPAIGSAYAGGYYAGPFSASADDVATHAIIVADKATGQGDGILAAAQETFPNGLWWIKDRANSNQHQYVSSVLPGSNVPRTPSTSSAIYAAPTGNSVAWCWAAPATGVTNSDGSIETTIHANADAGFSMIRFTGTSSPETLGHGLPNPPRFIISQKPEDADSRSIVYHVGIGASKYMFLNTNAAAATSTDFWGGVEPTDTVYSVGTSASSHTNKPGVEMVHYAWCEIPGYSSIGSYVGNGNVDGPFIYTGFRVGWLMVKRTTSSFNWRFFDSSRSVYNPVTIGLTEQAAAETTNAAFTHDLLSNGFKMRNTYDALNSSGVTYVYMAFAEYPFGGANVSPSPAR